jgi:hypothetical protein
MNDKCCALLKKNLFRMLNLIRIGVITSIFIFLVVRAYSQEANYDESKVPAYTLPDPLIDAKGKKIIKAKAWTSQRRQEILDLFRQHVYGKSPGKPEGVLCKRLPDFVSPNHRKGLP